MISPTGSRTSSVQPTSLRVKLLRTSGLPKAAYLRDRCFDFNRELVALQRVVNQSKFCLINLFRAQEIKGAQQTALR